MYFMSYCKDLFPVLRLLKNVMNLLWILIPIGLLLFGVIDLGKAVIASKEDEMKKAQGTLIKRVVYAIAVFLLFTIVSLVMNKLGDSATGNDTTTWAKCWSCASEKSQDDYDTCLKKD